VTSGLFTAVAETASVKVLTYTVTSGHIRSWSEKIHA